MHACPENGRSVSLRPSRKRGQRPPPQNRRTCHPERRLKPRLRGKSKSRDPYLGKNRSGYRGPLGPLGASSSTLLRMAMELCGAQDFVSYILQHIQGALHSYLAGKNRIFILDAEDSLVADFHVGAHDFFPGAGAVTVAHRTKGLRSLGEVVL